MRALFRSIFFIILITSVAGCSTTFFKNDADSQRDGSSSDPQVQYGGQFRVRTQASHGVNQ
jgi:hypothetical protein